MASAQIQRFDQTSAANHKSTPEHVTFPERPFRAFIKKVAWDKFYSIVNINGVG